MNWLVIWFFLLIFVTTMNKTLFSALKCPYPYFDHSGMLWERVSTC